MNFDSELLHVIRHLIRHPDTLINSIKLARLLSWSDLLSWRPQGLHSGTLIKLQLLLTSPETRCLCWLHNVDIYPPHICRSIDTHLAASTWRTYKSCISHFIHWHWSTFPSTPALPANPSAIRSFICQGCHPSLLPALTKLHVILQLPVHFHDPLTHMINKGTQKLIQSTKRDKTFLSRKLLDSVSQAALARGLHLFQAYLVIAYCFSLRVPSELLDTSKRWLVVDDHLCHLHLRFRKNSPRPVQLTRCCTCLSWGPLLCPVRAASIINTTTSVISPSAFNSHLKLCLRDAGVTNWKEYASHSLRRGHTHDLFIAGAPSTTIDASGGWRNPSSKFSYIDLQH
ncbi:hypothetical protein FOZ60_017109 [Perkinsus olseni]|uniref:Uncharacterized protein n=1 Tax=Perkinsus olseni TaxID=32597 RepID=A0A7J6N1S0_PEROL|nr:hypothetical protein FOZ60_017109 [Perkinsus olseni]